LAFIDMFGGGSFLSSPKAPSFPGHKKQSITRLMKLTAITPLLKAKIRQAFRVDQAAAWMYKLICI
jgi:hypothetical protein